MHDIYFGIDPPLYPNFVANIDLVGKGEMGGPGVMFKLDTEESTISSVCCDNCRIH